MRRRLLLSAGNPVTRIRNSFKDRVAADSGIFEAESCLDSQITSLRNSGCYDKASLILTPNAYKASKLYALNPTNGSGDFTFSRASTAMRRNSAGIWESVGNNVPRLNYPVGGGYPNWLFELQSTNNCSNSANASLQSLYQATVNTPILSDIISGASSYLIYPSTTGAITGQIYKSLLAGFSNGNTITLSARVKYSGKQWVYLGGISSGYTPLVWFDILNGVVGAQTAGFTGKITPDGNGYYLIQITGVVAGGSPVIVVGSTNANNDNTNTVVGTNGVRVGYIGAELGSVASSPIITAGSTATRVADVPLLTGASALVGQTEGTLYWRGSTISGIGTDLMIIGSLANSVFIAIDASRQIRLGIRANNVLVINLTSSPIASTTDMKISVGYKSGDIIVYCNGIAVITSVLTYNFSAAMSEVEFGRSFYEAKSLQNMSLGMLYTNRLTNAGQAALTN